MLKRRKSWVRIFYYFYDNPIIVRDEKTNDRMTQIIQAVRDIVINSGEPSLKSKDILKRMEKSYHQTMKITDSELSSVLKYYKQLDVIYFDQDENVVFLW